MSRFSSVEASTFSPSSRSASSWPRSFIFAVVFARSASFSLRSASRPASSVSPARTDSSRAARRGSAPSIVSSRSSNFFASDRVRFSRAIRDAFARASCFWAATASFASLAWSRAAASTVFLRVSRSSSASLSSCSLCVISRPRCASRASSSRTADSVAATSFVDLASAASRRSSVASVRRNCSCFDRNEASWSESCFSFATAPVARRRASSISARLRESWRFASSAVAA